MFELNVAAVETHLAEKIPVYARHLAREGPSAGGVISAESGLAEAIWTAHFLTACGLLYLSNAPRAAEALRMPAGEIPDLLLRMADFLLRVQNEHGRVDLLNANYDSPPDTGFVVHAFYPLLYAARRHTNSGNGLSTVVDRIGQFCKRAAPGLASGGFHTPNHRWVIASALAQIDSFWPDPSIASAIKAYLDEGVDIDAEGAYIERSVGVYDAVTNGALLFLDDLCGFTSGRQAAIANLDFNTFLLHADATAETGLSRRQDYGKSVVPVSLAPWYLYVGHTSQIARYVQMAQRLWNCAPEMDLPVINVMAHVLMRTGNPAAAADAPITRYTKFFPHNKLWRFRQDDLSVSAFGDATRLVHIKFGPAELAGIKIQQCYMGVGRFIGDEIQADGGGVILRSKGQRNPRRPGYELPLGRPVGHDEWDARLEDRDLRRMPPADGTLTITPADGGLSLQYISQGYPGVTTQIALDFLPGGTWETDDTLAQPSAGQVLFLKRGRGRMSYGTYAIEIDGGAFAHHMWAMRDSEPAPQHVRVLLTFRTPVSHRFHIRGVAVV